MQNNISNHDLKKRENSGWDKINSQLDVDMPVKKKDRKRIFWLFLFMGLGTFSFLWNQYSTSVNNSHFQEFKLNPPVQNKSENIDNPTNEPTENEIENAEFIKNKPIAAVENANSLNTSPLHSPATVQRINEKEKDIEAFSNSKKDINAGNAKISTVHKVNTKNNPTLNGTGQADISVNNKQALVPTVEHTMSTDKNHDKINNPTGKGSSAQPIVEINKSTVTTVENNSIQDMKETKNDRMYFNISFIPSPLLAVYQTEKSKLAYWSVQDANSDDPKTEITILKDKLPGEWMLQLNGDMTKAFNTAFPDYYGSSLMIGYKKQLHKFHFITQIGQSWLQSKNTYAYNFSSNSFTSNLDKTSNLNNWALGGLHQKLTIPADGLLIKEIKVDPSRALSGIQSDTLSISSADNLVIQNSNSNFSILKAALGYQILPKFYVETGVALRYSWSTKKYIALQSNVGIPTSLPSQNSITNYFLTTGHSFQYGLELHGIYSLGKSLQLVGGGVMIQNNSTNSLFAETAAQSSNSNSTRFLNLKNDGSAPHYTFNLGVRYRF